MESGPRPSVYHLVMSIGASVRQSRVRSQPPIAVLTWIRAALQDRPHGGACREANGARTALRPAPGDLVPPRLLAALDGQPLPVGGARHDPGARDGSGAGKIARGCQWHAIRGGRTMPEAAAVEPWDAPEARAAEGLLPAPAGGRGDLLGDGASPVDGTAGAADSQRIAPREAPAAGLGHRPRSPSRLRSMAWLAGPFGRE